MRKTALVSVLFLTALAAGAVLAHRHHPGSDDQHHPADNLHRGEALGEERAVQ